MTQNGAQNMGKWIDINVIPPQIYDTVLIRVVDAERDAETDVGFINEYGEWTTFNDWEMDSSITHWMPMPYPDLE